MGARQMVRVFDSFAAAERARAALLDAGFAAGALQFQVRDDEAGPVEGNFTVGNNAYEGGDKLPVGPHTYARNYARTVQRGHCMIILEIEDGAGAQRASQIMQQLGGADVDAITGARGP